MENLPFVKAKILECQTNPYYPTRLMMRIIFPENSTTFDIEVSSDFAKLFKTGDTLDLVIRPTK